MVRLGIAGEASCSTATPRPGSKSWQGRPWSFYGDGAIVRLVSEVQAFALRTSSTPCWRSTRRSSSRRISSQPPTRRCCRAQPLRLLLADDPGAGKTIMAGLLIKELIARGDLERCLIVCPGSLVEQWHDELHRRFQSTMLGDLVPNTPPCSCWTRRRDVRRSGCCGSARRRAPLRARVRPATARRYGRSLPSISVSGYSRF